jgi:nitroreductase
MENPAPTDHPIHSLLTARWSPRAFAAHPVSAEQLARLLEAARWAPSSYNEQPWAFLVATSDEKPAFSKMLDCLLEGNRAWASAAPVLVLTFAHKVFARNNKENAHAWHDVGQAIANLTFQATAEGLVVHQMAGILPDRIREIYSIPEDWSPVTGVAIGHPGEPGSLPEKLRERERAPRERKPLSEFVFRGEWGAPVARTFVGPVSQAGPTSPARNSSVDRSKSS